jgi:CBS domain-containing protein
MTRRDTHLDAMLRNLGAAYTAPRRARPGPRTSPGRWSPWRKKTGASVAASRSLTRLVVITTARWRVRDVMTTQVVTVRKTTGYKEAARLMAEYKVNAMPVVTDKGHVIGMVSEAYMLRKQERTFGRLGTGLPRRTRHQRDQAEARTAGGLMTSPAITIHPDAPLGAAARLMNGHNIRRLPVVDASGELIGIVSRRDLLSVFLRSDEEIAAEVRYTLSTILLDEGDAITVTARHGVVTLSGTLARKDMIPLAVRLASEADGVVSVHVKLGASVPAASA